MKKLMVVLALLGVSGLANAAAGAVCVGDAAATSKDVTTDSKFIRTDFKMKCSAKVYLNYGEDNAMVWVASASKAGVCYIIGNTNGGAPKLWKDDCSTNKADFSSSDTPDPDGSLADAKALGGS